MFKKINYILNIAIAAFIGVFVGHGLYVFLDYKTHPDIYIVQSAPWYTSIFVYALFTIAFLAAAIITKLIIRKNEKNYTGNSKSERQKADV